MRGCTLTSSYITSPLTQIHYSSGAYATPDLAFISVSLSPSSSISLCPNAPSSRWPLAPEAGSCHLHLFAGGMAQSLAHQCSRDAALSAPDEDPGHPTRPAVSLHAAAPPRTHTDMRLANTRAAFHQLHM